MEKNILIPINDEKIKSISEILGNKTCRKILEYLTDNTATETEISQKLGIALNTVDYNVKKLVKAGLIEKDSHWWSVKGKKMPSYKVSNKKIIISPKSSIKKNFALTAILAGLGAVLVKILTTPKLTQNLKNAGESTGILTKSTAHLASDSARVFSEQIFSSPTTWFLAGAALVFMIFLILNIRRKNGKLS